MKDRILVAGIGSIFHGDDAFGGEVVRSLERAVLPPGVRVADFGIRSYDLAFAILSGCDSVILVDALPRGEEPGTVSVLELDSAAAGERPARLSGHEMDPFEVLRIIHSFGGEPGRLFLVGCEPATLECVEGRMGLSAEVAAAVPLAVDAVLSLVKELAEDAGKQPAYSGAAIRFERKILCRS